MSRYIGVMVLSILMGSAAAASAQISADGSIRGYVRDEQQAALPGVTLTAAGTDVPASTPPSATAPVSTGCSTCLPAPTR